MSPILVVCSLGFYLLIATNLFLTWLGFFKKYTHPLDRRKFSYLITLVVGATFWPFVVPIAYMSVLKAKQAQDLC